MPPRLARFMARAVILITAIVLMVSVAVAIGHLDVQAGTFEYGHATAHSGKIVERPYPVLLLDDGKGTPSLLLVAPGKHGADDAVRGLDGRSVALSGTRIQRGGHSMIEVDPASIVRQPSIDETSSTATAVADARAPVTLTGEIVDSKCFLGVMVPGSGKTHKDCASLCLRGGIPPALYVHDRSGASSLVLLAGMHGEPIGARAAPLVGEAITVTGTIERTNGWLVLRSDPSTWTPLSD